jgi:hypothetical protein
MSIERQLESVRHRNRGFQRLNLSILVKASSLNPPESRPEGGLDELREVHGSLGHFRDNLKVLAALEATVLSGYSTYQHLPNQLGHSVVKSNIKFAAPKRNVH